MADFTLITSRDNPRFKYWTRLLTKKYRDKDKELLLEGDVLIKDALASGAVLKEIILSSSLEDHEEIAKELLGEDLYGKVKVFVLADELFKKLGQTENGRDTIALINIPHWNQESFEKGITEKGSVLIMDRLQDPGNVGTLIRTADGAGFSGIIAIKGTCDIYSPKVVRATAGSLFRVPIIHVEDEKEALNIARELGLISVAADASGKEVYWEANLKDGIALIVGNEGAGVSDNLISDADLVVRIPMDGKIESLNAAVAASLIIYESVRQKMN